MAYFSHLHSLCVLFPPSIAITQEAHTFWVLLSFSIGFPSETSGKELTGHCRRHETWIRSLGQKDLLDEGMAPTPVLLPRESHGQRILAGYSSEGHKELDMKTELNWLKQLSMHSSKFLYIPILWPPDAQTQLTGKDPDAGKDWGQEKGVTEDKMTEWHHWLNGHKFEQTLEESEGQGSLACCSPWGRKESDST